MLRLWHGKDCRWGDPARAIIAIDGGGPRVTPVSEAFRRDAALITTVTVRGPHDNVFIEDLCPVTEAVAEHLDACPLLRALVFENLGGKYARMIIYQSSVGARIRQLQWTGTKAKAPPRASGILHQMPRLRELIIDRLKIGEKHGEMFIMGLRQCRELRRLDVSFYWGRTGEYLMKALLHIPNIEIVIMPSKPPTARPILCAINAFRSQRREELRRSILAFLLAHALGESEPPSPLHWLPLEIVHLIVRWLMTNKPPRKCRLIATHI